MELKQISFRHHKNAPLFFEDLSFYLEPGKLHALHGKNGVGKSVLLNILSGRVDPPAVLTGKLLVKDAVLVNQRFDQMIADQFTFEQNLQFAAMKRFPLPFSRLLTAELFPDLSKRFHIHPDTAAHKLSGGQRQILSLLMVLQKKVSVLLLDEPTAALDEQNAAMVFEFLSTLPNITILAVCHDKELISRYATGSHFTLEMSATCTRTITSEKTSF